MTTTYCCAAHPFGHTSECEDNKAKRRAAVEAGRYHLIADIRYEHGKPSDQAPLTCTCSWSGISADFQEHRRSSGAKVVSFSQGSTKLP